MSSDFYAIAKTADILNKANGHISTARTNFTHPHFKNPNSYVNLLGDIIWIKDNLKCDVTKADIRNRCKCSMNFTVDRLVGAGFIQRAAKGVYTPTSLGREYFKLAKFKFVDNAPKQMEFPF